MTQETVRDEFVVTLDHIERVRQKLVGLYGPTKPLSFPDHHKLAEGLFLSAWTHWEQFLRKLFTEDLASLPGGALRREIKQFRTKNAPARLADRILDHPDERRWIEWSDFKEIAMRGDSFLGSGNRFRAAISSASSGTPPLNQDDLATMKRIRNAVAHKSDYAWDSFRNLAQAAPFSLTKNQMKGITVGRFLISHQWNARPVLEESLAKLKANAQVLVT